MSVHKDKNVSSVVLMFKFKKKKQQQPTNKQNRQVKAPQTSSHTCAENCESHTVKETGLRRPAMVLQCIVV